MKIKKIIKLTIWVCAILFLLAFASMYFADENIASKSRPYIYETVDSISEKQTVLVLGTSKYVGSGRMNLYFVNRIDASVKLYQAGKVRSFLLSGDNSRKDYDEPEDMKNMLIERGVPDSIINLDYAGFRTFDSVVRADKVFGQQRFIIVSQPFHVERAVYIARRMGLDAYGFNAQDVNRSYGFKTQVREKFARVKVFIDLIFNKQPKFLGDPIEISVDSADE